MSVNAMSIRDRFAEYITNLQQQVVATLEELDPESPGFNVNEWIRSNGDATRSNDNKNSSGGGGKACVLSASANKDSLLEKAAVNISLIHGTLPPASVKQMATQHSSVQYDTDPHYSQDLPFFSGGISIVIHPRNPNAPSAHANYRYFEILDRDAEPESGEGARVLAWWFGGITDLTPSYLFEEDARHFHGTLKLACDRHGAALYPAFKRCCDEYLYIPHRQEHRGLGGLRFDDLCDEPHTLLQSDDESNLTGSRLQRPRTPDEIFALVRDLGDAFIPSYRPILLKRLRMPFTSRMRRWQLIRRGHYIEFNLVYERGTKFGLATPGVQTENVLVSLPEEARWEYMCELGVEGDGSKESEVVAVLKYPRDWTGA
ncbi:coproporphyrinogen III oxidase [Fistulina hepatica ATCC 64428]|uniref:coproporphyrinogen oxidase n=1 Tax=Fistulina hepatica ATCC 64428 TaxID=1128425 RepID=A0A0D7AH36_9AGAR|nr:coproporphyrinogen III oxidase [Fistulina hepatica ATCC 64428]